MSYCPKCGSKIREDMNFCPKCGASLKVPQPPAEAAPQAPPPPPYKAEKAEKREKEEKEEKHEKEEREERYEKREFGFMGPLIGGLFLIFLGFIFYLIITAALRWEAVLALFLIAIGIIIIAGAAYAAVTAARRHPPT